MSMWKEQFICLHLSENICSIYQCRNAGFDPALFRVDIYGNVIYWKAHEGSPLAWSIDHWFPRSRKTQNRHFHATVHNLLSQSAIPPWFFILVAQLEHKPFKSSNFWHGTMPKVDWFLCFVSVYTGGGKSVPSNLRLVQWQVQQKKENKLEFLVPWWDLQIGVSVIVFLSVFSSPNADFRLYL